MKNTATKSTAHTRALHKQWNCLLAFSEKCHINVFFIAHIYLMWAMPGIENATPAQSPPCCRIFFLSPFYCVSGC